MAIRYMLMAVSAPFSATLADKMPRKRLMLLADLTRAVLDQRGGRLSVPRHPRGACLRAGHLAALLTTPFLVAQRSLLPSLANRPAELTAANGTASTIEGLAFFAGRPLAALLLGFTHRAGRSSS